MVYIILGTKSLKELNSELDFSNNVLRFKKISIFLKTDNDVTIKPGQTKVLTLYSKLHRNIGYAECMVKYSTLLERIASKYMLCKVHQDKVHIQLYNNDKVNIKIKHRKLITSLELKSTPVFYQPVHQVDINEHNTVLNWGTQIAAVI